MVENDLEIITKLISSIVFIRKGWSKNRHYRHGPMDTKRKRLDKENSVRRKKILNIKKGLKIKLFLKPKCKLKNIHVHFNSSSEIIS